MKTKRKQMILPSPDPQARSTVGWKRRIFKQLIAAQILELNLSEKLLHPMLVGYYLIHAYSVLPQSIFKDWIDSFVFDLYLDECVLFGLVWTAQIIAVQAAIFCLSCATSPTVEALLHFNVVSTNLYLYIGFPSATMLHGRIVARSFAGAGEKRQPAGSNSMLATYLFVPVSHLLVYLALRLKCSIPSNSPASAPSATALAVSSMLFSLSLILMSVVNAEATVQPGARYVLLAFVCLIYLLQFYVHLAKMISWSQPTSILATKCLSMLVSLFAAVHMSNSATLAYQAILFLITQTLVRRLSSNLMELLLKVDIFEETIGDFEFKKGVVMMMSALQSEAPMNCPKPAASLELTSFYLGLWEKKFSRSGHGAFSVDGLVAYALENRQNSRGRASILLLIRSTRVLKYFRGARASLEDLKAMSRSDLFDQFEAAQYEALWQSKFETLYSSSASPSLDGPEEPLFSVTESMRLLRGEAKSAPDSKVDCLKTFKSIGMFEGLSSLIETINRSQLDLYQALSLDTQVSLAEVRQRNRDIHRTRRRLQAACEAMTRGQDCEELFSYLYPSLLFFYALVQYDIERADRLLQSYKKKLGRLFTSSTYRKAEPNSTGLEIDAVTMQVQLEKESLGLISELSLNANHFLGRHSGRSLLNRSVNTLLPQNMWEQHNRIMLSDRTLAVINRSRSVFIKNFEGNLKQCVLSTRLAPSVAHSVSAFSSLTFNSGQKGPSVLLDMQLNIVAADTTFNQTLLGSGAVHGSLKSSPPSLAMLSRKLCSAARIILRVHTCLAERPGEAARQKLQGGFDHLRERLFSLLGAVLDENQAGGMLFTAEKRSPLHDLLQSESVHARFEFIKILGIEMVKLFISRKCRAEAPGDGQDPRAGRSPRRVTGTEYLLRRQPTDEDEDEDSNKVARDTEQLLPDYNSEYKESAIGRARKRSAQFSDFDACHIPRFEDTLFPLLDMVESAASKMPQAELPPRDRQLEEILAMIRQFRLAEPIVSPKVRNQLRAGGSGTILEHPSATGHRETSFFGKSNIIKLKLVPSPSDQFTGDLVKKSTTSLDRSTDSRRHHEAVRVSTFHTINKLLSILSVLSV